MDGPISLFLQKLNAQIEDLEITAAELERRLISTHLSDSDRKLFGRLLATVKEQLSVMNKNRATLVESYAILDACRDEQHPLFRPETAANLPTLLPLQTAAALGDGRAG